MENEYWSEPNPEIVDLLAKLNDYQHQRIIRYAQVADQLDMLFKDIDAGLFGEGAKTGLFYSHVKSVKDEISKPDVDTIKSQLDKLISE